MRNIKCSLDITTIGILPLLIEDLGVEVDVVVVDGAVEGDGDHLRHSVTRTLSWTQTSGYTSPVLGAETVWQDTNIQVTGRSSVRVSVLVWDKWVNYLSTRLTEFTLTTRVLIRSIITVLVTITEQFFRNTSLISARQLVGSITDWLISHQQRLHLPLPGQEMTIVDGGLPVTGLLLKIKSKAWRTSDLLQTLSIVLMNILRNFQIIYILPPRCTGPHLCNFLFLLLVWTFHLNFYHHKVSWQHHLDTECLQHQAVLGWWQQVLLL